MPQSEEGRILLVDDQDAVLRAYQSVLARKGWTVETAQDGREAWERIEKTKFDVIVSDINMPGYDGLSLLRGVRERDIDVPVILVTGTPSVATSVRAIEHGVFRYLIKPVANENLLDAVNRAVRLHKLAQLKRRALEIAGGEGMELDDRAALGTRFDAAIDRLWMAFQPIVSWRDRRVYGYEALLRSDEPTMTNPLAFLTAAEQLGRLHELGRAIRANVAVGARKLPAEARLFVNLHASDLSDPSLRDSYAPLSGIAHRVVLEVTERASLEGVSDVPGQIKSLKALGFHIAVDDLGAGYAGLSSFTLLEPEVVKLDMSLIRGIDTHTRKRAIVGSMKKLCDELGMLVVAEGVETPAERDALTDLGFDLLQGYLFARPERNFSQPIW